MAALDEGFVGEILEPHLKFEMPRVLPLDEGIGAHVVVEAEGEFVGVETRLPSANIVDRQAKLEVLWTPQRCSVRRQQAALMTRGIQRARAIRDEGVVSDLGVV